MNLTQAHKLFCYPSLVTYLFLYTRQLFFNQSFNKSNLLILALIILKSSLYPFSVFSP